MFSAADPAFQPQSQSVGSFVADRDDSADRTSARRTDRNTLVADRNAADLEPARGVHPCLLASAADFHDGRSNGRAGAGIDDPSQDGTNETIGGRAHSIHCSFLEAVEPEIIPQAGDSSSRGHFEAALLREPPPALPPPVACKPTQKEDSSLVGGNRGCPREPDRERVTDLAAPCPDLLEDERYRGNWLHSGPRVTVRMIGAPGHDSAKRHELGIPSQAVQQNVDVRPSSLGREHQSIRQRWHGTHDTQLDRHARIAARRVKVPRHTGHEDRVVDALIEHSDVLPIIVWGVRRDGRTECNPDALRIDDTKQSERTVVAVSDERIRLAHVITWRDSRDHAIHFSSSCSFAGASLG